MQKNSVYISGLFPLADFQIQITSNSAKLMDLFFKKYHCVKTAIGEKESTLQFMIYEKESGEYLLSCPLIDFKFLIENKSPRQKMWCVVETIKIVSYSHYMDKGFLFLHGSAVMHGNSAFVFSGISGSGKSTISNRFKPQDKLADDQVILKKRNGAYFVYSSPFNQKLKYPHFNGVPLSRIYFIGKSPIMKVKRMVELDDILSALMINDLFNSVFEFYLNQNDGDNSLHVLIAKKMYTPSFKRRQLKSFLIYAREMLFFKLQYPKNIAMRVLLRTITV